MNLLKAVMNVIRFAVSGSSEICQRPLESATTLTKVCATTSTKSLCCYPYQSLCYHPYQKSLLPPLPKSLLPPLPNVSATTPTAARLCTSGGVWQRLLMLLQISAPLFVALLVHADELWHWLEQGLTLAPAGVSVTAADLPFVQRWPYAVDRTLKSRN